ncbi:soluble scavenger receptor cysteine-rich domain-containing protein SSC5D-like [Amphibalanus amphitrite]|uniref:soluble scavenger receptor cysteine-rich domain-containing protein SSC5D-like n=1 Tax=Amphibalanus amphitrite TaxID=1232801 RepID=UPI001C8FD1C0|nr:soluble scavenger receptor cysteine-rich domain-containing protein SSC5D-like [Amphibalanus amphitrite]
MPTSFFDREFERLGAGGDSDVSGVRTNFQRPGEAVQSAATDGQRQFQVRLVGGSNSREGNVEVLIYDWSERIAGWRSVCDIGWTQAHAEAACRQLGFPGPAVATRNGRFGYRSSGFGTMVSNCQVGAGGRGLRDCMQRGVGSTVGCRSNNVAGVICGSDPSSPYSGVSTSPGAHGARVLQDRTRGEEGTRPLPSGTPFWPRGKVTVPPCIEVGLVTFVSRAE